MKTMDMQLHEVGRWDLAICHPPCTRLCNSGQRWLYFGDEEYRKLKHREQLEGVVFFMQMFLANSDGMIEWLLQKDMRGIPNWLGLSLLLVVILIGYIAMWRIRKW